jgi:Immunity protein 53
MHTLQDLQRWYHSPCDGDCEHGYRVEIGTLDNPEWRVSINLVDTPLAEQPFTPGERFRVHSRTGRAALHGR